MLELRLGQQQILETKKKLPARAGLIGESLERLRKQLETVSAAAPGNGIISIGQGSVEGVLAAIALVEVRERARSRRCIRFWPSGAGGPAASAGTIASALGVGAAGAVSAHAGTPAEGESAAAAAALEPVAREMLRTAHAARWRADATPAARRAIRRLAALGREAARSRDAALLDRKSTRLNSSHVKISYAVFCLKKKREIYCRH